MPSKPRWLHAVNHRGYAAERFLANYFAEPSRRPLIIGGAGFDPRSTRIARLISGATGRGRLRGFYLREERPRSEGRLRKLAERNIELIDDLLAFKSASLPIISDDGAVIGGQHVARVLKGDCDFEGVTDVVVDFSALSKGVVFPIVKALLDSALGDRLNPPNVHLVVTDHPRTDLQIVGEACERAEVIKGFQGRFEYDEGERAAKLWLPQLTRGEGVEVTLDRLYRRIEPDAVCPILPFPSDDPYAADLLVGSHIRSFEQVWEVDARDVVYASEKNPLDLYRTILRIHNSRGRVFGLGNSMLVLSPVGSKALAIGALMAAYEADLPVLYVESMGYGFAGDDSNDRAPSMPIPGEIVHVWLSGDPYPRNNDFGENTGIASS
jgi:hypothetical protein